MMDTRQFRYLALAVSSRMLACGPWPQRLHIRLRRPCIRFPWSPELSPRVTSNADRPNHQVNQSVEQFDSVQRP